MHATRLRWLPPHCSYMSAVGRSVCVSRPELGSRNRPSGEAAHLHYHCQTPQDQCADESSSPSPAVQRTLETLLAPRPAPRRAPGSGRSAPAKRGRLPWARRAAPALSHETRVPRSRPTRPPSQAPRVRSARASPPAQQAGRGSVRTCWEVWGRARGWCRTLLHRGSRPCV